MPKVLCREFLSVRTEKQRHCFVSRGGDSATIPGKTLRFFSDYWRCCHFGRNSSGAFLFVGFFVVFVSRSFQKWLKQSKRKLNNNSISSSSSSSPSSSSSSFLYFVFFFQITIFILKYFWKREKRKTTRKKTKHQCTLHIPFYFLFSFIGMNSFFYKKIRIPLIYSPPLPDFSSLKQVPKLLLLLNLLQNN